MGTPSNTQSDLILTGTVNNDDLNALSSYLNDKAWRITSLDLSALNLSAPDGTTEMVVAGFAGCNYVKNVILPTNATAIGENAFKNCTSMKALVFEGTKKVGTEITLGANIVNDTHKDLQIFMPAIKEKADATAYQKLLSTPTHFDFPGYSAADAATKLNTESYSGHLDLSNGVDDLEPGGNWGK